MYQILGAVLSKLLSSDKKKPETDINVVPSNGATVNTIGQPIQGNSQPQQPQSDFNNYWQQFIDSQSQQSPLKSIIGNFLR